MPFGVVRGRQPANGGADIGALVQAGVPAVDLAQDGTRYFDLHHTPDDTLDKIEPVQLRQNVVVWSAVLAILANSADSELPCSLRINERFPRTPPTSIIFVYRSEQ